MKVSKTKLEDCMVIEPETHVDDRGFFVETFRMDRYAEQAGIRLQFVQDNFSFSHKRVLRGLHFQKTRPQGRLVSVAFGKVFDVALDIRSHSPTFGKWEAFELSAQNKRQVWVPPGFAHGFLVISDSASLKYKCTDYYCPNDEGRILWNDPKLGISWPIENPILSEKDACASRLDDIEL